MDENDRVPDDEELYRNVRSDPRYNHYSYKEGRLEIRYHAFWDESKKPSVDRAKLLDNNPQRALLNATNGIVSIKAGDVRAIGEINDLRDSVHHAVEVVFCPTLERPAHSQIIINPEHFDSNSKQRKAFRLLQKALARLANETAPENGWTWKPQV